MSGNAPSRFPARALRRGLDEGGGDDGQRQPPRAPRRICQQQQHCGDNAVCCPQRERGGRPVETRGRETRVCAGRRARGERDRAPPSDAPKRHFSQNSSMYRPVHNSYRYRQPRSVASTPAGFRGASFTPPASGFSSSPFSDGDVAEGIPADYSRARRRDEAAAEMWTRLRARSRCARAAAATSSTRSVARARARSMQHAACDRHLRALAAQLRSAPPACSAGHVCVQPRLGVLLGFSR